MTFLCKPANVEFRGSAMIEESPASRLWKNIGVRTHHGIVVPLFSLHSQTSCGIGEFTDLIPLFPWCKKLGLDIIQLLPLNDTGQETSPYSALSAFALNPIHLALHALPYVHQDENLQNKIRDLQKLTAAQRIPYSQIYHGKATFLRDYFQYYCDHCADKTPFQEFKEKNKNWCFDYALFKAIKIKTQWQNWELWPPEYRDPHPSFMNALPDDLAREVEFHQFVQYLCCEQFQNVKTAADAQGVFLKGDIPILINRESADVWRHRNLFNLQYAAGAPPDLYAAEGQKWGFPLYDWDALAVHDYQWWVDRLEVASRFYHIYRIDHIVGFYRIWGIPLDLPAKEGYFISTDKSTWIHHGETILRVMLEKCDMLPIGEDLGTVPPEVRLSLRELGICGTKVMRWERRWDEDGGFIDPKEYPTESMTTVSTHDSETLWQWWKEQPKEAELYATTFGMEYQPDLTYEQRMSILHASHTSGSLFHINLLNEYLALFPSLVWPDPEDERINIPGTISEINWTYRFRPSVEEIVNHAPLSESFSRVLGL